MGGAANFLELKLFALAPLCLQGTTCILFVQPRRKSGSNKVRGTGPATAVQENKQGQLLLFILFSLLSLRCWEVIPTRKRRGLISLNLHCTKDLFAYLYRWLKNH